MLSVRTLSSLSTEFSLSENQNLFIAEVESVQTKIEATKDENSYQNLKYKNSIQISFEVGSPQQLITKTSEVLIKNNYVRTLEYMIIDNRNGNMIKNN